MENVIQGILSPLSKYLCVISCYLLLNSCYLLLSVVICRFLLLFVVISCYLLFSRLFILVEITTNNNAKQQNNNVEQQIPTDKTQKSLIQDSKINIQVVNHSLRSIINNRKNGRYSGHCWRIHCVLLPTVARSGETLFKAFLSLLSKYFCVISVKHCYFLLNSCYLLLSVVLCCLLDYLSLSR